MARGVALRAWPGQPAAPRQPLHSLVFRAQLFYPPTLHRTMALRSDSSGSCLSTRTAAVLVASIAWCAQAAPLPFLLASDMSYEPVESNFGSRSPYKEVAGGPTKARSQSRARLVLSPTPAPWLRDFGRQRQSRPRRALPRRFTGRVRHPQGRRPQRRPSPRVGKSDPIRVVRQHLVRAGRREARQGRGSAAVD